MPIIDPFANNADSVPLGDLTIENGSDRISLFGSLQITRDKAGLQLARELKELLDATVSALQNEENLPDHVPVKPADKFNNPFN